MTIKQRRLSTRYDLYIPTKARDAGVEGMLAALTGLARGMTAASVQGGYVFPLEPGKVMLEGVVIYTFYTPGDRATDDKIEDVIAALVHHLIRAKGEDTVLTLIDGLPILWEEV